MGGRLGIFVLVAIAALLWWQRVPDASQRFDAMHVDTEAGRIEHDGVTYSAELGAPDSLVGDVRVVHTVERGIAPVITHEVVLTTGDYSDPELVEVTSYGPGRVQIEAKRKPSGSITMVHVIPGNAAVAEALDALEEGEAAVLEGRPVVGALTSSAGGSVGLSGQGHALLLAERVSSR